MIQRIKLSNLTPNSGQIEGLPANPRLIKDYKFEKLKKSLKDDPEMLELRELLVFKWGEEYVIIGGNMRYRAAVDLDIEELPCKIIPPETPIEKLKAYVMKDNIAYGDYDYDMLANDWDNDDLQEWGLDVWNDEEDTKISEDDAPEIDNTVEPIIKLGDVWQLGSHRLLCGDSTNKESVLRLMGKTQADLYLSDPPYNVAYEGKTGDALTIQNDSMSDIDFCTFLHKAFESVDAVLKDGGSFYIWHAGLEGYNFREACKANNWRVRQCLIWNKNSMVMGRQDYQWKHEPCLYGWKDGASHTWYSDRKQTTVIDFDRPTRNGDHPTMKPVGLMGYLIKNSTKIGQVVLDTFGGSGSTLMACEQLDRICYIVELDPHYADVIVKRWEEQTEQKAVLLENITQ